MNEVSKAVELFRSGFMCTQAVFAAFSEKYGVSEGQALRIGSCFGSRMNKGDVCGTCTGTLKALGLAYGNSDPTDMERHLAAKRKSSEFLDEFKRRNGKLEPLGDGVIDKVYALARSTQRWSVLQGCVAIILGCAAGLKPQEARQLYVYDVHHQDENPHIYIRHVKDEGSWGRARDVPLNDDVSDIIEKYLRMRELKLRYRQMESEAMFPPFRSDREFVKQQSISRYKKHVEQATGETLMLRGDRPPTGRGCSTGGSRSSTCPTTWGTTPWRPRRSTTRTTATRWSSGKSGTY